MKIKDRLRLVLANGQWWPLARLANACDADITEEQALAEYARLEKAGSKSDRTEAEKIAFGKSRLVSEALRRTDDVEQRGDGVHREYRLTGELRMDALPVTEIPIDAIRIDGGTQQRSAIQELVVGEYALILDQLPPAEAVFDGKHYWLWDGFHRYHAHRRAARPDMPLRVRKGTQRDAVLLSVGANRYHGLRRSKEDARSAIETLLNDDEWSKRSIAWICEQCGTHFTFTEKVVAEFYARTKTPPPAERVGKDGKVRPSSNGKPQLSAREVDDEEPDRADDIPIDSPAPSTTRQVLVRDGVGLPLEGPNAKVWEASQDWFKTVESQLRVVRDLVAKGAELSVLRVLAGRLARKKVGEGHRYYSPELDALTGNIRDSMPFSSVCPYCHHAHPGKFDRNCKVCDGKGWVTESAWKNAPEDYRLSVESLRDEE